MNEPVAYLNKYKDMSTNITKFKPIDNNALVSSNKLYTAEQLHQRVKMTQAEFDEFKKLYNESSFKREAFVLSDIENEYRFRNLRERFGWYIKDLPTFADLWVGFNEGCPENMIEITTEKKWFVRSKEKNGDRYLYLKKPDDFVTPWYTVFKDMARYFDTKEEAEKWTNPLTEAVQLPVEVGNDI